MDYHYDLVDDYDQALRPLRQCNNISSNLINDLWLVLYKLHQQKRFSKPVPTIGMYITVASLFCILAMVADLMHGLKHCKLWFPCFMDQQAKLGSVAFMCIMMTFLLPSIATMNGKELVTNIIALGLLDLESKYQEKHEIALRAPQQAELLTVDNLKQRVINYGILARTGSPQLMTICSATCSASTVICVSISSLHVTIGLYNLIRKSSFKAYDSDYKWSILVIFVIQSIGITLGSIVLCYRFYAPLLFKPSTEGIRKLIKFYEVESYWTHTLSDWKQNRLYSSSNPNFKIVFYKLQILGLTLLTLSQKAIVTTCKAIRIIPVLISICVSYFIDCVHRFVFRFKSWLVSLFGIQLHRQPEPNRDIRQYVLQPQDGMEVGDTTLYYIFKGVERSIQNAEKQQPSKLMKLLENFRDFEGVIKFDSLLQSLPGVDYPNCWSLPVVTLATIALSLHRIQPSTLKNFLNEVSEGLVYVKLVEKSLNNNDELVSVQKAAERLWPEVEVYHKWLGNNLQDPDFRVKTAKQIVERFNEKARNMETVVGSTTDICADSMRRVTQTILLFDNINEVSQEELFEELSSMISEILAACLTNLPEVITMKCSTSAIEKREESVHAAATLLGKTSEIINTLSDRVPASLINNPGELPFIDKWRGRLMAPAP
ncbi:hypothetical protein CTI12_AA094620 [Artemisia annua]|uniref:Uncharacterized protein n=1 Tax=Artemisia annua TaxID=35608 RepID=A0A2U1PYJ6_ARTAN|nr:hypothetical protein CTI12_AA094620 [Artemisia annua]